MKKKIIIALIVLVCVIGLGALGIFMYKKYSKNSHPVDVYSVQDFVGGWYGSWQSMDGSIRSNSEQNVYIESDKVIKEVLVDVGDEVHAGDVILKYDTTLLELQLETQKTQIEVYKTNLQLAEKELKKLKNTTPVEPAPEEPDIPIGTPTDAETGWDPNADPEDFEITYTKEELDAAIINEEANIRDIKLQIERAELQLKMQQKTVDQGTVIAKMDGVVQTVDASEENIASGRPIVVISGDGSYSAVVSVGEWDLAEMEVGSEVSVYCYENGNSYTGIVTEVSNIPTNGYNYSEVTESFYPITISIRDGEYLSEGMWVEVTMDGDNSMMMGNNDDIVLPLALVKEENGKYYVMKQEDGRLKKQYIKTGKIYYGSEIEVKAGLTPDDFIAFPYSKDAVEGKKCKENPNGIYY